MRKGTQNMTVLIPAYEPTIKLLKLVLELKQKTLITS